MQENKTKNNPIKRSLTWVLAAETAFWLTFTLAVIWINAERPDDFYFRYPIVLWLNLFTLPFYFILFRQRKDLRELTKSIPARLVDSFLKFIPEHLFWRKWILFRLAIAFFILALAQPLFGVKQGLSLEKNSEVVIAMDVSNSMNTRDIDPEMSRLEIAKRAATELINGLEGERLGVLIFAGNAYVQLPITKDYNAAKLFISEIDTRMLSNQGTNFEAAITKSLNMFSDGDAGKCILMITDGENHEKVPDETLESLPGQNVFLAVVGLGTSKGGLILRDPNQPFLGYVTDNTGKPVLSKVGANLVKDIAKKAQGISMVTENPFPNLSKLLTEINQLNKGDLRHLKLDIKESHFQWPLLLGILLWIVSFVSLPTLNKRKV